MSKYKAVRANASYDWEDAPESLDNAGGMLAVAEWYVNQHCDADGEVSVVVCNKITRGAVIMTLKVERVLKVTIVDVEASMMKENA